MPFSYAQYTGNGSATTFAVPFPYLLKAHVKLYLGYNLLAGTFSSELVDGTGFTWTSGTQVQTTVAPAIGQTLTIIRQTPTSSLLVQWQDGSNLVAGDLQDSSLQTLYAVQEQQDRNGLFTAQQNANVLLRDGSVAMAANFSAGGNRIINLAAPTADSDAVNRGYVNSIVGNGIGDGDKGDIVVSGNGSVLSIDAGAIVNADVNASAGIVATKLAFTQSGTGATARSVQSKLGDVVSVKDFGATGDFVTDDIVAIQAAIDSVEASRGVVFFPNGRYRISTSIRLPSFVTLQGESQHNCFITNQYAPLAVPHIVNKDPYSFIFATIRDIGFFYATYGLKVDVTAEASDLRIENVTFNNHIEASVYVNQLLQTSTFQNVYFYASKRGMYAANYTANQNTWSDCHFIGNTEACVELYLSQACVFNGCHFEQGNTLNKPTIKVYGANALSFNGCYFESTNEILLQETGSTDSVTFDNCHFTGAIGGSPSWTKYKVVSDGVVTFGTNNWGEVPCDVTGPIYVRGINNSISAPNKQLGGLASTIYTRAVRGSYHIVSPTYPCPNLSRNLIKIQRFNVLATNSDIGLLTGILTTNLLTLETGGFERCHTGIYRVTVRYASINTLAISTSIIKEDFVAGSVTFALSSTAVTAGSATIVGTFAGELTPATQIASAFKWSFESLSTSTLRSDELIPSIL